jgi:integrase/recombinase XerD
MERLKSYLLKRYRLGSVGGYLHGVAAYLEWVGGEQKAATATYAQVIDYLNYLRDRQLKTRSVNNYLFAVKIYYHYLRSEGIRADHPCERLQLKDRYDRSIHLDELYTKEQLERLEKNYQSNNQKLQLRNKIILGLLIHQALTVTEICSLDVEQVDLKTGEIQVNASGNNRGRILPLKPFQVLPLNNYLDNDRAFLTKIDKQEKLILNKSGQRLDPHGISRIINGKRKGKERFLPKRIRQSVIHQLLKSGHDLRIVQAFAGHRQLATTEAYQNTKLDELKSDIQKYHPLQ